MFSCNVASGAVTEELMLHLIFLDYGVILRIERFFYDLGEQQSGPHTSEIMSPLVKPLPPYSNLPITALAIGAKRGKSVEVSHWLN